MAQVASVTNNMVMCLDGWVSIIVQQKDENGKWSDWSEPRTIFVGEYLHDKMRGLYPNPEKGYVPDDPRHHLNTEEYNRLTEILEGGPGVPYIHTPENGDTVLTDVVRYEWDYVHTLDIPQGKFQFQVSTTEDFSPAGIKFDETIGSSSNWIEINFSNFEESDYDDTVNYIPWWDARSGKAVSPTS